LQPGYFPHGSGDAAHSPLGMASAAFRYDLPDELIAQHAAEPRDAARLLVRLPATAVAEGSRLHDATFSDLPRLLPPDAHLVFNESRVFAARMLARPVRMGSCAADAPVEVMFLAPEDGADASHALSQPVCGQLWRAMVRLPLEATGLELRATAAATESALALSLRVERVVSEWREEGESPGVEVAVRLDLVPSTSGDQIASSTAALASSLPSSSSSSAAAAAAAGAAAASPLLLRDAFSTLGAIPLPPYIQRQPEAADATRYQAVYASAAHEGSVAAPTAGLHFTSALLDRLSAAGVASSRLSLHVGAGTFKPIAAPRLAEHQMHAERFSMRVHELAAIAQSLDEGRPIVPVGTTSTRVLESLYWFGVHRLGELNVACEAPSAAGETFGTGALASGTALETALELGHLEQWTPYEGAAGTGGAVVGSAVVGSAVVGSAVVGSAVVGSPSPSMVLRGLASAATARGCTSVSGSTALCIAPGYQFRVIDALITNFHAPDSTLMLLVSALLGSSAEVHAAYAHAIAQRYRFLSYGDACLFFPHTPTRPAGERLVAAVAAALPSVRKVRWEVPMPAPDERPQQSMSTTHASPPASPPALPEHLGLRTGRKVLLHSCCAPCSGAMVEAMVTAGHDVTIFFYNPNIHPRKEYELRIGSMIALEDTLTAPNEP